MQIVHILNHFFYTIFPDLKGKSNDDLVHALEVYYKYGPYKPKVSIHDKTVKIELDEEKINSEKGDYQKVLHLCDHRNFTDAKSILKGLIEKNTTVSEYHRVMGQILSEEGNQDGAIDHLIDALRWDSHNGWALLMMGNIFSKFKNDIPTAIKYYDQALVVNPEDHITINNIAANLMQQGKLDQAKNYLNKGLKVKPDFPNTLHVLAKIAFTEDKLSDAFGYAIDSIRHNHQKDVLFQHSVKLAFDIANDVVASGVAKKLITEYKHKLEFDGDRLIDILEDSSIANNAKLELAENYDREKHMVKFKPGQLGVEHLIMHELVHLDFVIQARKEGNNLMFVSTQEQKYVFQKSLQPLLKTLRSKGYPESTLDQLITMIFEGTNSVVFNAPVDLFIENFLYLQYEALRPYQFLSINNLIQDGIEAVTNKDVAEITPKEIIAKTKIYNLVGGMQFRDLYGVDLIDQYQANKQELVQASTFYKEYLEYSVDRLPGEEYELVQNWADDLELDKNFELVDEKHFRSQRADIDHLLTTIENDPYELESSDPKKANEMEKFLKSHNTKGLQLNIVMYMIAAISYLKGLSEEKVKDIAVEIAQAGIHGIDPNKDGYKLAQVSNKRFNGNQFLSWYYVSWAMGMPDAVGMLGLPFEKEYDMAKGMSKG